MATPLRVLIVEHSADDALLAIRELRRAGFEPTTQRVATARQMAAALDQAEWDLVLASQQLPRFTARAALRLLRDRGLDLPCIVLAEACDEAAAAELLRAGAHRYLLKSQLALLAPAVERELREARERAARRQAEQALRHTDARWRALIEHSAEGIGLLEADGTLLYLSPPGARLLGFEAERLVGRSAFDLIHPADQSRVQALFAELLRRPGDTLQAELRVRRGDDAWRWLEASGANQLHLPGVEAVVASFRDATERQLHQATQAVLRGIDQRTLRRDSLDSILQYACEALAQTFDCPVVWAGTRQADGTVAVRAAGGPAAVGRDPRRGRHPGRTGRRVRPGLPLGPAHRDDPPARPATPSRPQPVCTRRTAIYSRATFRNSACNARLATYDG